jgi:hypothetical protein
VRSREGVVPRTVAGVDGDMKHADRKVCFRTDHQMYCLEHVRVAINGVPIHTPRCSVWIQKSFNMFVAVSMTRYIQSLTFVVEADSSHLRAMRRPFFFNQVNCMTTLRSLETAIVVPYHK